MRTWELITGDTYNPWGDIAAIIGVLDGLRTTPPPTSARQALEHALASAVSDLAPS